MKKSLIITAAILILMFIIASLYSFDHEGENGEEITIAASFYSVAEFSRAVGGDSVSVRTVTPAGSDPHSFEPTPRDITRIMEADLFLYHGAGLDPWAERIAEEAEENGVAVIEMTRKVSLAAFRVEDEHDDEEEEDEDGHDHRYEYDPHIWLDPLLAVEQVEIVRNALIEIDPAREAQYRENAGQYITELRDLHQDFEDGLAGCEIRTIIVAHAAFHYLTERYDIEMIAASGLSPETEPSLHRIREVTELAREHDIRHIFFETLTSPQVAETVAEEVEVETLVLNPLEGLTQEEIETGESYLTVMQSNLDNLRTALRCQ